MSNFKIIKTYKVDRKNGFKTGQIIKGDIELVELTDGKVGYILQIKDSEYFLYRSQVQNYIIKC